jgi:hypothetical protein
MKGICVYCGSSPGLLPGYTEAARQCGQTLAARGLGLVYGGGNVAALLDSFSKFQPEPSGKWLDQKQKA